MAGYVGSERATLYKGNYKPAELYAPIYKKTRGVNLFRVITPASREGYGMSIRSMVGDSFVTLDGTSTSADAYLMGSTDNQTVLEKGVYTISVRNMQHVSTAHDRFLLYFRSGKLITVHSDSPTVTFELTEEQTISYFGIVYGKSTYNKQKILIQIEKGSTATEWEPYSDGEAKLISWGLNKYLGYKTSQYTGKEIAVQNTYNDTLDLLLKGEHSQKKYSGKNLLPNVSTGWGKDATSSSEWQEITFSGWSYASPDIPAVVGVTYTVSVEMELLDSAIEGGTVAVGIQGQLNGSYRTQSIVGRIAVGETQRISATLTLAEGCNNISFQLRNNISTNTATVRYRFAQAEVGPVATEWEPYVGGAPAPSPQFPQQIECLSEQRVTVTGNMFNYLDYAGVTYLGDGIWQSNMVNAYYISWNIFSNLELIREYLNAGGKLSFRMDNEIAGKSNTIVVYGRYEKTNKSSTEMSHGGNWVQFTLDKTNYGELLELQRIELRVNRGGSPVTDKETLISGLAFYWGDCIAPAPKVVEVQQLAKNFNLYGADGVYDTLEPCVLVDGEWKCRVTRYWWSVEMQNIASKANTWGVNYRIEGITGFYIYHDGTGTPRGLVGGSILSTHAKMENSAWGGGGVGVFINGPNPYFTYSVKNSILADTSSNSKAIESFVKWLNSEKEKGTPVQVIYRLETPIVELYDPIMLNTNPYTTIIKGNADMLANIKTVEY